MEQGLFERLQLEKERQGRSETIVRDFLAGRKPRTLDHCDFCGWPKISIIARHDRYGAPIRSAQCNRCGLVFLADKLSPEDYGEFYKSTYRPLGSAYLNRMNTPESMRKGQRQYGDALVAIFQGFESLTKGGTMLDVGGSTGEVASAFREAFGYQATVLDPSPDELKVAESQGHAVLEGLLEAWEPPAGLQFDLVLCCRTIDHFLDLRGSLTKLRSLLAPGGTLLIDIIDFGVIWDRKGRVESAIKLDHCYYLSSENAPHLLANAGLEVMTSELATDPEHVTYLCRAAEPKEVPENLSWWAAERLRAIQTSRVHIFGLKYRQPTIDERIDARLSRMKNVFGR